MEHDIYPQLVYMNKNNHEKGFIFRCFRKLWKATISFVMYVRLTAPSPHGTTRLPLRGFSWYLIFEYLKKLPRKFKFHWNHTWIKSTLYKDQYISWIKIDQLDVTCFIISLFNAQHVSNVSTAIFRSLRLICGVISWVVLLWFEVCWCYGVVRLGWCGIVMQAEALVHTAIGICHKGWDSVPSWSC
jgi:hypothetical protein